MKMGMTTACLAVAVGCVMLMTAGCSKKSVQASSGSKSSEAAKRAGIDSGGFSDQSVGAGKSFEPDYSTNAPSLSLSGGDLGGGLGSGSEFGGSGAGGGGAEGGGSSGGGSNVLSGFDSVRPGSSPSEERLGGGTMLAKVQPGEIAARQAEELRQEQMASVTAGLEDVFFGYDSWQINENGRRSLAKDADWIRVNPGILVKVEGHCDERGTGAYNLVLGEKRAKAVRNYLIELGVSANQLAVVSYGKERPFCMEHAESCYQQNRRGHLVVKRK
jgi:peptidoglycan-associated lipoprotein